MRVLVLITYIYCEIIYNRIIHLAVSNERLIQGNQESQRPLNDG